MKTNFQKKRVLLTTIINAYIFISTLITTCIGCVNGAGRGQLGSDLVGLGYFKAFTIDSNVLAGIASLIILIFCIRDLKEQKEMTPKWAVIFQYIATVSLLLTFVTVVLFLTPTEIAAGEAWQYMFTGDMFFFHIINPFLTVFSFICLQRRYRFRNRECLWGMIPFAIYAVIYMLMVLVFHKWDDFYDFTFGGLYYLVPFVLVIGCLLVLALGLLLIYANRVVQKRIIKSRHHHAMKELEYNSNLHTNRIIGGFLIVEFAAFLACTLLSVIGVFEGEVFNQVSRLLIAGIPGAVMGLLALVRKDLINVKTMRTILCVLMCFDAFAMAFFAYSYAGTFALLFPIILAALYPRSKACTIVSVVMVIMGIILPLVALFAGKWDGEYYQFLYTTTIGHGYDDVIAGNIIVLPLEQILRVLRYVSTQNLMFIGCFSIIGHFIYLRTNNSYEAQEEIIRLSETDELTGLLNRNCFERRMESRREPEAVNISCFYFDVNGLHELNNLKGHKAGDIMLQFVAKEIQNEFGKENSYRVGGDEYVAFSKDIDEDKLSGVKASLEERFASEGYTAAIGYAHSAAAADLRKLSEQAEKEMYHTKQLYYAEHDRSEHPDRKEDQ